MRTKARIELVKSGILWRKLVSLMDETAQTLVRTSFSTLMRGNNHFACVVSDARGQLLAQSSDSIPSFVETVPFTLRSTVRKFPSDALHPGDVLITNDPWLGTGHLNDVSVAMPIFFRNKHIGFVANVAHHNDIGGSANPYARKYFEEGLLIPIVKAVDQGRENPTFFDMSRGNVRSPEVTIGDLSAQMASLCPRG